MNNEATKTRSWEIGVRQLRIALAGKFIGQFKSEGIAHPTKRMITLAVNQSAWVDDVKVWKLKR